MKTFKVTKANRNIPKNFTGVAEYPNGTKHWYKEGKLHREDGPAVEWIIGYKEWWVEGLRHRTDGPAIEYPNVVIPDLFFKNSFEDTKTSVHRGG
jgi:hypothetical protein